MENNQDIDVILYKLEQLLYGYNYQVTFGIETFGNCHTIKDFKIRLKEKFPDTKPESVIPIPTSIEALLAEIDFALEYREDNAAGVKLTASEIEEFTSLKEGFLAFLHARISPESVILSYPDEKGIPGYPVFWDYRFIILSPNTDALFVFGSSSD